MLNMLNNFFLGVVYKRHLRSQCGHCQPNFYLHIRCHQAELVYAVGCTEHFRPFQFRHHFGPWYQCVLWVFFFFPFSFLFFSFVRMPDNVHFTFTWAESLGFDLSSTFSKKPLTLPLFPNRCLLKCFNFLAWHGPPHSCQHYPYSMESRSTARFIIRYFGNNYARGQHCWISTYDGVGAEPCPFHGRAGVTGG